MVKVDKLFLKLHRLGVGLMTSAKTTVFVLVLAAMVLGCTRGKPGPAKPARQEWPQKCEMCGAEWRVTPDDPNEAVPPTVEWCFHDGSYCDVGLDMMIDAGKNGKTSERERQWLNHCLACKGCRCAAFDPDEWRKIIDAIKKIKRANGFEAMPTADLQRLADRQEEVAIGLTPIAVEQSKRQDAKAAKEELSRRSKVGGP